MFDQLELTCNKFCRTLKDETDTNFCMFYNNILQFQNLNLRLKSEQRTGTYKLKAKIALAENIELLIRLNLILVVSSKVFMLESTTDHNLIISVMKRKY